VTDLGRGTPGSGPAVAVDPGGRFSTHETRALGSRLRLTIADDAAAGAERRAVAWAAIGAVFGAVDDAMSRFREDSELTRLHRSRSTETPSRMLASALIAADRAARMTGGRFDARVMGDLERLGAPGIPQAWADWDRSERRALQLDGRRAGAPRPAGLMTLLAPVDLGGIGKGLALRWAARRAATVLGDTPFLLDAGGDFASRGRPGAAGWSIAIEDPAGSTTPVATCELLPDQAIATSSVRISRWLAPDGRQAHHLIDPATGEPGGDGLLAVTVAWPDPAWAEVWSKALFLEGAARIADTARRRDLAAWWVGADGTLSMTPAARQQTTWVRAEAPAA
jgi:thiamine biosynthesis lipoprotein